VSTGHRKLTLQLGVLGSGVLLGLAIRFAQGALVARLLGVAEFGRLAAVMALVMIVARVNDFGLPGALGYHFRRTPGALSSLLRAVGFNFIWCSAVAAALAFVAAHLPLPFAGDLARVPWMRLAFATYLAVATPAMVLPTLFTAAGEYGTYVRVTNLDALAQTVLVIGACVFFDPSYQYVIAALSLEQIFAVAVYLWLLRRYQHRAPAVRLPAREVYSYGLRLQWGVVMKLLSSRADLLIVSAMLPAAQVGLYSVALAMRDLGLLPQSVYAAPFTNLVIDRSQGGAGSDRLPVLSGLLLQIALSLVMAMAALVALPLLIPLVYGAEFAAAVGPSTLLFSSVIFMAPASLCWMAYNAKGRPDLTSLVLTTGGLLGPALTFALVSSGYGLYGASLAAVIAAFAVFLCSVYFLIRMQRYRGHDFVEAFHHAGALARSLMREVGGYLGRVTQRRA
jgi:O-antigen/teichoic acid export membrane protein